MAFTARRSGVCKVCNSDIIKDVSKITWDRKTGNAYHIYCAPKKAVVPAPMNDTLQKIEKALLELKQPAPQGVELEAVPDYLMNLGPTHPFIEMLENITASKLAAFKPKTELDTEKVAEIARKELAKTQARTLVIEKQDAPKVKLEMAHEDLGDLIKLCQTRNLSGNRMNVYMYGPAGSGKSSAARQASEAMGLEFGYSSLNPMTPDSRALGFVHAGGEYVESEFYRRYTQGGVFCFDEIDNASASFVTTLNSALENGHGAFPHGVYKRHPDFVCICTANTIGRGGDVHYPERRALDGAFLERFVFLEWGYDVKLTRAIVAKIIGGENVDALIKWVDDTSEDYKSRFPDLIVSPRAYIQSATLQAQGFSKKLIENAAIARGLSCK